MKKMLGPTKWFREGLAFSPLQYMLDTAEENPSLASFYTDDEKDVYVCLFNHMLFIGGEYDADCFHFIVETLIKGGLKKTRGFCYIFCDDAAWITAFNTSFIEQCENLEYSLYGKEPGKKELSLPPEIREIREAPSFDNYERIVDEVLGTATYDGMEDFFGRGICFAPVIDNRISGFCTSEYPSERAVAIGIAVATEYQRKGYAKAMTQAFLCRAAEKGLYVYWDCRKSNAASRQTALSCGFTKVADYSILLIKL